MISCPSAEHPRVLVVEDEPLVRLLNVDVLSEAGFDVYEAADADEALQLLTDVSGIRVVFTDVEMPGHIDGFALAKVVEAKWPDIAVVVTSGRRMPNEAFPSAARCFVPKPYAVSHVVELIGAFVHARH